MTNAVFTGYYILNITVYLKNIIKKHGLYTFFL